MSARQTRRVNFKVFLDLSISFKQHITSFRNGSGGVEHTLFYCSLWADFLFLALPSSFCSSSSSFSSTALPLYSYQSFLLLILPLLPLPHRLLLILPLLLVFAPLFPPPLFSSSVHRYLLNLESFAMPHFQVHPLVEVLLFS